MTPVDAIQFGLIVVLAVFFFALYLLVDLNERLAAVRRKDFKSSIANVKNCIASFEKDVNNLRSNVEKLVKADCSRRSDVARAVCPEDYADDEK